MSSDLVLLRFLDAACILCFKEKIFLLRDLINEKVEKLLKVVF